MEQFRDQADEMQYNRRIFLFTTNDNPEPNLESQERQKLMDFARSLPDQKVNLDVFPLVFDQNAFDYKVRIRISN